MSRIIHSFSSNSHLVYRAAKVSVLNSGAIMIMGDTFGLEQPLSFAHLKQPSFPSLI
jgi:hypothetical protein